MKKIAFAVSVLAVSTVNTLAADMALKAGPIAPVAYYDWSGVYVGVHAGYGGGMKDWSGDAADFPARGFLGGAQVGINKQIASFVFGLELDGSWANFKGSQNIALGGALAGFNLSRSATSKIDGIVTLAGRAGLAADRWFVFAKGGVAYVDEQHAINIGLTTNGGVVENIVASGSENRWAPMVGFGAEYALGGNWSVKGEYDYIHLGTHAIRLNGTDTFNGVPAPFTQTSQIEQAIHVAKVGVNYRFGGLLVDPSFAPVPAAPGYNWSGAYVGAVGGYGWSRKEWPDFVNQTIPGSGKFNIDGGLAGVTIGANAQSGVFVLGAEGEWMWTGIKGGQTFVTNFANLTQTTGLESKANWLAIAAARAGFVVGDRLMVYGKAGVAIAEERHTANITLTQPGVGSLVETKTGNAVHTGAVGGVGAEYALGSNWSAKVEYDYIKMTGQAFTGTGTDIFNLPPPAGGTVSVAQQFNKMSQDMHLIKFGVNYHFNPVPVVVSARY